MVQGLGATFNVMALFLVNMIGYTVGIKGTGRLADGIFLDRDSLITMAYGFAFLFSGVQASGDVLGSCDMQLSNTTVRPYYNCLTGSVGD